MVKKFLYKKRWRNFYIKNGEDISIKKKTVKRFLYKEKQWRNFSKENGEEISI